MGGKDSLVPQRALLQALSGKGAHVQGPRALERLDWKLAGARPEAAPHSVFQIVNHMIFWQDWVIRWLDGDKPAVPKRASGGWPGKASPAGAGEWAKTVRRFVKGLDELRRRIRGIDLLSGPEGRTRLETLHALASHNSHHLGQVVLLRQLQKAWPPPSGGLTW
jgi:uncharacterized damage-inducible protein DinB